MKGLTSIRALGKTDMMALVGSALDYADTPAPEESLRGRAVAMLFFERSTRTRLSFELASMRLGAHVLGLDPATASTGKGESLRDTVTTVVAIGADILVVRHSEGGIPDRVAEWTGVPVVNAGDGTREHPTQALVDLVTLYEHFGAVEGLSIGIVGDILHSRVVGSLLHALPTLGAHLTLVGPPELLPPPIEGITMTTDLEEQIEKLDVAYMLRVQTERGAVVDDSYRERYRLDRRLSARMAPHAVVMHPGPLNRGIEIADEVADGPRSLILRQVSNGVPTRMAVLSALEGAPT